MEEKERSDGGGDFPCCHPGGPALTGRLLSVAEKYCPGTFSDAGKLLDIGCGSGLSEKWIGEKYPSWQLTGVDPGIPEELTQTGQEKVKLLRARGEELPFPPSSFDLVLMECTFSALENPEAVLAEILRVMKPEGKLLISDLYLREEPAGVGTGRDTGEDVRKKKEECDPKQGESRLRIGRLETAAGLAGRFTEAGFHFLEFSDTSRVLGEWAGQAILDGRQDEAERAIGWRLKELKALRCGYCLAVLEKSPRKKILEYALAHSLFYQKTWRGKLPERWEDIPLTTPEDLKQSPEAFLCVPPKEVARIVTLKSSGSLDRPKRLFFTEEDIRKTADFFAYGIRPVVQPGWKVLVFMNGSTRFSVGGLLKEGLAGLPAEVNSYGFITNYRDAAEAAAGFDTLIGLPAQIFRLAKTAPWLRPKTVLLSGDYVPEAVEDVLEKVWGCRVFSHWGMTETGYGGAVQCGAGEGYHIRDEDLLLEILDPDTGKPVPEGGFGEIVLTTTRRQGMPLIRYRTGDRGRMLYQPCPCGCLKPRLDRVTGRLRDRVMLKNGKVLDMPALDELLFGLPDMIAYRAVWNSGAQELLVVLQPPEDPCLPEEAVLPEKDSPEEAERKKWQRNRQLADRAEQLRKRTEELLEREYGEEIYLCVITGEVREPAGPGKRCLLSR